MISHKYKCIFIHIQRTGGSSIEKWITGNDWWKIEPKTKHIFASQAKKLYSKYWDEYFKFSFVRNPWDRMISASRIKKIMPIRINQNKIYGINEYKKRYGYPLTLEYDFRFFNKNDIKNNNHKKYQVYNNILDEKIDFIGKYENFKNDIKFLKEKLKINKEFNIHIQKTKNRKKDYKDYYNENSKKEIENIFYNDIINYNYYF